MPKSKTDFTNFVDARPNYFPGQFLLEDDFEVEQKYLIDRQKYHRQSLHVSGLVEGLEVEVIKDKQEVQIKSGSAINSNGDLIILKKDTSFSKFAPLTNGELYISYKEEKQVKQQEDFTRWQEVPTIDFAATTPNDGVKLAKISIVNNVLTLDLTVRDYSGIFLPNATGNDLTLRSGGNANPNVAILNGSLTVTGTITGKIDATNINSGVLAVDRIPDLSANKITSGTISGSLTISSTGNVGIRTTTPSEKLEVAGNLKVTGTITGKIDATSINSGILDAARIPNLPAEKIVSGVLNAARIDNNSLSSNKIISLSADKITAGTTTGNLTIGGNLNVRGTSSFAGKLTISGSSGTLLQVGAELDSTANIDLAGDVRLQEYGTKNCAYLQARNDNSNRNIGLRIRTQKQGTPNRQIVEALTISPTGNVGIGTETPSEKLEVSGNLKVTGTITGKIDATNINALENLYTIYLRGSAYESSEGNITFLKIANFDMGMTTKRGLNTIVLNPNGTFKSRTVHDVYSDKLRWNSWADWVNTNTSTGDVVAVASYDALNNAQTGGSAETLLRSISASRAFQAAQSNVRSPYALLFIKGQSRCIEVSQPYKGSNSHLIATYYFGQLSSLQNAEEPWQTPSLLNGWVTYDNGYNPPGYFKDSFGIVHLRGLVKDGVRTTIFTLPVGYRPAFRELQAVLTWGNTIGQLDIQTNGQVLMNLGNNAWFSLDGVTFRAAQ